jgi:hypothetical protein
MAALKKSLGDDKKAKPAARKPAAKRAPARRAHSRKAAPARKRA